MRKGESRSKQGRDEIEGVRMGRKKGGRKDYTMSCMSHDTHTAHVPSGSTNGIL